MNPKEKPLQNSEPIQAKQYLEPQEIQEHLDNVEYIIMAQPSVRDSSPAPIHFTIFLNTQEPLPEGVKEAVFDKFCEQYEIFDVIDLLQGLDNIAFSLTQQETPMPMHLFKAQDKMSIPNTLMYIFDFEANAKGFEETKKGLTGWSYSYN